MAGKETPLMKQYNEIKQKYPETILLFRLGDFFETFGEDAITTAKVCGITLTKRNNGAAGAMELAGFPHHQLDTYLPKIVKGGYRVAVCEQLEDPKQAKGIVKRGVVEVVSPGVALYEKLLDSRKNNYLASVSLKNSRQGFLMAGIAAADISTGEFFCSEIAADQLVQVIEHLAPAELIINKAQKTEIEDELNSLSLDIPRTKLEDWIFDTEFGREQLLRHFKTQNLKGFGIENMTLGLSAAGSILHYFNETQQGKLNQIKNISIFNPSDYMILDYATRRNLEITFTSNEQSKDGTLISILDESCTPMGGRLFKKWISRPLKNLDIILQRQEAVESIFNDLMVRLDLRAELNSIGDLERLISKVCTGRANPRDLVNISYSLKKLPEIQNCISKLDSKPLNAISERIEALSDLNELIDNAILDEPSTVIGSGNVFRIGYNHELDTYLEAKKNGKKWVENYKEEQKAETGIPTLKVGFNNVFGYYIEVTKVHTSKVPESYTRKQTLTNSERYITPELKEIEDKLLSAEEKIGILENDLFTELRNKVTEHTIAIQQNSYLIAQLDCLQSFAHVASEYNYVRPEIDDSTVLEIEEGRHPVVERILPIGEPFTANSTTLNTSDEQIHIITGPNMSGKSVYLRQTALMVLLAQIGSFVPAKSAKIGLVDRIFTRVGAQDNMTAGESTFLVEMQEAANILNNASERSLILLDEVGRGTATFDGISIAWSIAEYIHDDIGAKTLFATHYHELNDMEEKYKRIINYSVEVIEAGSAVVFSHKVKKGSSDHSFGIYVAQMAGLPYSVVDRADKILKTLESNSGEEGAKNINTDLIETQDKDQDDQLAIFEFRDDTLREKILNLKIDNITPIQALQILSDFRKEALRGKKRR